MKIKQTLFKEKKQEKDQRRSNSVTPSQGPFIIYGLEGGGGGGGGGGDGDLEVGH